MSQVNYKIRMRTYRENHLDNAAWEKKMADIKAGRQVGGVVKIVKPLVTVADYARKAYVEANGEGPKDEAGKDRALDAGTITSIRNGLMDDVGQLFAQTSIVKVDGKEMTGEEWFEPKIKAKNSKLKFRDFGKALEDLAKAHKGAVVHRGVQWELPDAILNYSSGRKGKQKKSILKTIDEI